MRTPACPNGALEQRTEQRRARQLGDEHEQQHDVERLLGLLEHRGQPRAPGGCPRRRVRARGCGSCARTRSPPPPARSTTAKRSDDRDQQQPVGAAHVLRVRGRAVLPGSCRCRNSSSNSRSRRRIGLRLALLGVVVVRADAGPRGRRAARARRRATTPCSGAWRCATAGQIDDVAEHDRGVLGFRRRSRAPPALVGPAPAGHEVVVDREREHVGRAGAAEEALVEVGDRRARRRRSTTARRRRGRAPRSSTSWARRTQRSTSTCHARLLVGAEHGHDAGLSVARWSGTVAAHDRCSFRS